MSNVRRHLIRNKGYESGMDALLGDAPAAGGGYGDMAALLARGVGEAVDTSQAKKAADAKSKTDKAASDKAKADNDIAVAKAQDARNAASQAASDASVAALKATAEQEPYGPLHVLAKQLTDKAAMLDATARQLEAKAGGIPGAVPGTPGAIPAGYGTRGAPSSTGATLGWVAAGTVGAGLLGLIGYKLLHKKKGA